MIWTWIGFIGLVSLLLAIDLGWLNRKSQAVSFRKALMWSGIWIGISLAFTAVVYDGYEHHRFHLGTTIDAVDGQVNDGASASVKYLTGYLLEKALSVDNLFVMAVIFQFLAVPEEQRHRVLSWGIIAAMALRGALIAAGAELVSHHHWVRYVFGGILLYTGFRMLRGRNREPDPSKSMVMRAARRILPLTPKYHGKRFVATEGGRRMLTPLALAMILVEGTDVVFATDSIPAIFAVTADPLLVFTSNIFAVLGMRSLYFALAGLVARFDYLKVSLALILMLVGAKIMAGRWVNAMVGEHETFYLLALVAVLLGAGVMASLVATSRRAGGRAAVS